jgi:hypothetical protein
MSGIALYPATLMDRDLSQRDTIKWKALTSLAGSTS